MEWNRMEWNPLLFIRRHATTMMDNSQVSFDKCMDETKHETEKVKCMNAYIKALDNGVNPIKDLYEGYLKNYSEKDGKLVKKETVEKKVGSDIL